MTNGALPNILEVETPQGTSVRLAFARQDISQWKASNKGWYYSMPWIALGLGLSAVATWYWLTSMKSSPLAGTSAFVGILVLASIVLMAIGISTTFFYSVICVDTKKGAIWIERHAMAVRKRVGYSLADTRVYRCQVNAGPFVWSKPLNGVVLKVHTGSVLLALSDKSEDIDSYILMLSELMTLSVSEGCVLVRLSGIPKSPIP